MGHYTGKARGHHFLKRMEEFKLGSWAWTKNRHANISSMARFRYALESFLNDERKDALSKPKVGDRGPTVFVERSIRLDNDELSSWQQGRMIVVVECRILKGDGRRCPTCRLSHER